MITSFRETQKTLVFSKNENFPIGMFIDFVINPDNGIFEAIWIKTDDGLRLLSPHDIWQWRNQKMIINDENDLTDPEHFPKIQKVIEREIPIINAKVFINQKLLLGRVVDFSFDTLSPRILTLIVRSGFWIWGQDRIVPQSRIIKISSQGILISNNILKTPEREEPKDTKIIPEIE